MNNLFLKRLAAASLFVTLGVVLGAGMISVISAQGNTIYACVNPAGQLRIVNDPSHCKSQETPLDWSTEGPPGAPGPAGISGYQIVTNVIPMLPASANQFFATCPAGKKVLGGGVSSNRSDSVVFGSKPSGDDAWLGEVFNPTQSSATMTVYAICAFVD